MSDRASCAPSCLVPIAAPATLDDALAMLAQEPGAWRPFAGGTDLMVLLEAGKLAASAVRQLWG